MQPEDAPRRAIVIRADEYPPPFSIEAERSVLGSMLVSETSAVYALEQLDDEDFYRHSHRLLFSLMRKLVDAKMHLDEVTLFEAVRTANASTEVGGPIYIAELANGVPHGTNVTHYAAIVRDLRVRRDVYYLTHKIQNAVMMGELNGPDLLTAIDGWLLELQKTGVQGELVTQEVSVQELYIDIERRIQNKGALTGIDTGLLTLNEMTSGWQAGDLILIAARPGIGKTSVALGMAIAAARSGTKVAVFSLEMSRQQVEYRLLSALSEVMLFKILNGHLKGDYDFKRVSRALEELHGLSIAVDDTATMTVAELRGKCRRERSQRGLGLVVVDYLQLLSGSTARGRGSRTEEVTDISRRLKLLAKEMNVPVIALSQLSRASEGRDDKRPRLSDLRESGSLEQDADIVVLLHRLDHKASGDAEVIVEKQRNGPVGPFVVHFEKDIAKFSNARVSKEEPLAPSLFEDPEPSGVPPSSSGRPK